MTKEIEKQPPAPNEEALETLLFEGNLAKLSGKQKADYLLKLCDSTGLDPLTKPFDFIPTKEGKLVLYANKSAAAQLRKVNAVDLRLVYAGPYASVAWIQGKFDIGESIDPKIFMVVMQASRMIGEQYLTDFDIGTALMSEGVDAPMKAYTKAKRRVTLSICGIGFQEPMEGSGDTGVKFKNPNAGFSETRVVVEEPIKGTTATGVVIDEPATASIDHPDGSTAPIDAEVSDNGTLPVPNSGTSVPTSESKTGPTGKKKYPPAAPPVKVKG